ncbi:MAG: MFS transporter [Lachnospiraceae bacterium]|nr:MFS transporter [Lachnospiraceae bacterium]
MNQEKNNMKLTKLELSWVLYDVGNSAFTLLVSTILPIYFNALADEAGVSSTDYLAWWGYAASIATLLVAFIGPVFGTFSDQKGKKKPVFIIALLVGAAGCASLAFSGSWIVFLVIFIIAKTGYSSSLVFYDSMLTDVTSPERMDNVSSKGYAWGYIGSCIPFVISLVFVLMQESLGISMKMAIMIALFINTGWWLLMSVPLLKNYRQIYYVEAGETNQIAATFRRLGQTFKELKKHKNIFVFLLAFFFYIDGVYTIIEMATAYGQSLGLDTTGLLLALLLTQIVAFPFALLFGRLAARIDNTKLIKVCILAYFCIAVFAIQLDKQWEFWLLAVAVGMFQGAIQALSRSYFARIIPPEKSGEFFGIFDICGKGASFMGTALMAAMTQITDNASAGVGILSVMFIIGFLLFGKAAALNRER